MTAPSECETLRLDYMPIEKLHHSFKNSTETDRIVGQVPLSDLQSGIFVPGNPTDAEV